MLQGFIERIFRADRLLASLVIDEAVAAGVAQKKIDQARKEMAGAMHERETPNAITASTITGTPGSMRPRESLSVRASGQWPPATGDPG